MLGVQQQTRQVKIPAEWGSQLGGRGQMILKSTSKIDGTSGGKKGNGKQVSSGEG